jgi:sigma-B regulation protein RsbU (phosphoserine phosphatase)
MRERRNAVLPGGRRTAYFGLLAELTEAFTRSRDFMATLLDALQRIAEEMNVEAGCLFQLDGEFEDSAAKLICRASVGPVDMVGVELPAHAGVVGRALAQDIVQVVNMPSEDHDFLPPRTMGIAFDVRSVLAAPVVFQGRRFGAVELFNRRGEEPFGKRDASMLAALASVAALVILNAELTEDLVEQARIKRELELAAAVQRKLLPAELPVSTPIHGLSRAARDMSGDFYDVLPLRDGRFAFALADVSGKGMDAALIMVQVATLFRSLAKRVHGPGRLLARIEAELCESLTLGMFVTMVVGVYDPRTHEVRLANAGHLPPLLRDADGHFTSFESQDPPLGVRRRLDRNRYHERAFSIAGGALYLYTDGATEARRADGGQIGAEGLQVLIERCAALPASHRLETMAKALDGDVAVLRDDLTLLVIEDTSTRAAVPRRRRRGSLLVEQVLPAQAPQLRIVRRLILAAAREAGAPADWAQDFALAVDEACQNIIRHGYRGRSDGRIELRVRRARDGLCAELVDFAPQVDKDRCKGRPPGEAEPGGLGTRFMRELTDRVYWGKPPAGAGNRLLLSKRLPPGNKPT